MSNQSLQQASIRAVTGTTYDYNGDWSALFDLYSIPAGDWNGRMLQWLNTKLGVTYTSIAGAQAAYAAANGVAGWNEIGTITDASPAVLWTPLDLGAALRAWWDADDHGTARMVDDGAGLISSWTDKVGSMALTATTTARPTWSATAVSGTYAGLTADGIANCLTSTTLTTLPTGATAGDIYAMATQDEAAATVRILANYGGGAAGVDRRMSKTGSPVRPRISDGTVNLTDTTVTYSGLHILSGFWSGTTEGAYFDAVATTPATAVIASLATGTARFRLFSTNATTAANFWLGIGLQFLITTTLGTSDRQKLEGWLAWKYAATSLLPVGHPYKSSAPTV